MNTKFSDGIKLHKEVIHVNSEGHSDACTAYQEAHEKSKYYVPQKTCRVCAEEAFIKKLSNSALELVCKECFGDSNK